MGSNVNLHRHLLILCAVSSVGVGRVGAQQTVALVLAQRNSGFHQAIACGARAAAMELGVTINVQAAAVYSAVDQIPLLYSVMATAPDAIVIDPAHATSLLAPLREAARSGAKIVAVDTSATAAASASQGRTVLIRRCTLSGESARSGYARIPRTGETAAQVSPASFVSHDDMRGESCPPRRAGSRHGRASTGVDVR